MSTKGAKYATTTLKAWDYDHLYTSNPSQTLGLQSEGSLDILFISHMTSAGFFLPSNWTYSHLMWASSMAHQYHIPF